MAEPHFPLYHPTALLFGFLHLRWMIQGTEVAGWKLEQLSTHRCFSLETLPSTWCSDLSRPPSAAKLAAVTDHVPKFNSISNSSSDQSSESRTIPVRKLGRGDFSFSTCFCDLEWLCFGLAWDMNLLRLLTALLLVHIRPPIKSNMGYRLIQSPCSYHPQVSMVYTTKTRKERDESKAASRGLSPVTVDSASEEGGL